MRPNHRSIASPHLALPCVVVLLLQIADGATPCRASMHAALNATERTGAPLHSAASAATGSVGEYIFIDGFDPAPLVDCGAALSCPLPKTGKSCVTGRLTAAGSGMPLQAIAKFDLTCGGGAVGGPCDLALSAHDAVQWAINPGASTPLASTSLTVDGCGRFLIGDLDPPGSGHVAIVVDDADASPQGDYHVPTATFHDLGADTSLSNLNLVATLHDTVDGWTLSAGAPFGANTFEDVGVILFSFKANGYPRAGVIVTESGSPNATGDYYFADAQPLERLAVDASLSHTGADGSALFVNGLLTNYSGAGAEPMGCTWPSVLAATVAGAVVFIEIGC